MSKIGSNIRKIRTVKALSQTEFASLFKLTRASIGAYEEGRAEPKIDAAIEIAKYFNISLADIFTKDVTVNQLTNFVLTEELSGSTHTIDAKEVQALSIVSGEILTKRDFATHTAEYMKAAPRVNFPNLTDDADTYIELKGANVKGSFSPKIEAVVGRSIKSPTKNVTVFVISGNEFYLGTLEENSQTILLADTSERFTLAHSAIYYHAILVIYRPEYSSSPVMRKMKSLEDRIIALERKK